MLNIKPEQPRDERYKIPWWVETRRGLLSLLLVISVFLQGCFLLVGTPHSTLGEGTGLVYKYSLKGSDSETHTARLVIWYDDTGEIPLSVEAGFGRYQMQANLLTALMKVQFRI